MQFLLELCPFPFAILAGKPYFIVSEGFIKRYLFAKCLHQSFDGIAGLNLLLPILRTIVTGVSIVVIEFLAFKTHISIGSFGDLLVIIIVAFRGSEGNGDGSLSISDALKGHALIGSCIDLQ